MGKLPLKMLLFIRPNGKHRTQAAKVAPIKEAIFALALLCLRISVNPKREELLKGHVLGHEQRPLLRTVFAD